MLVLGVICAILVNITVWKQAGKVDLMVKQVEETLDATEKWREAK